jgi:hypothetical protein
MGAAQVQHTTSEKQYRGLANESAAVPRGSAANTAREGREAAPANAGHISVPGWGRAGCTVCCIFLTVRIIITSQQTPFNKEPEG